MRPEFPRINEAIRYTLEYYNTGRIRDYLLRIKTGSPNYSYLDNYEELIFILHDKMEDEILQTIQTTNHSTQVYLLENLKEWLEDWRIYMVNKQLILDKIEEYNEKSYPGVS